VVLCRVLEQRKQGLLEALRQISLVAHRVEGGENEDLEAMAAVLNELLHLDMPESEKTFSLRRGQRQRWAFTLLLRLMQVGTERRTSPVAHSCGGVVVRSGRVRRGSCWSRSTTRCSWTPCRGR
jgi:hypothetical protein